MERMRSLGYLGYMKWRRAVCRSGSGMASTAERTMQRASITAPDGGAVAIPDWRR